jgi:hypothetical protein
LGGGSNTARDAAVGPVDAVLGDVHCSGDSFLYGPYARKVSDEACRLMDGSRGRVTEERGHRDKPAVWNVTSYYLGIVFGVSVLVGFWVMNINHSSVVKDNAVWVRLFNRGFRANCGSNLGSTQSFPAFNVLIRVRIRIRIRTQGDGNHVLRDEARTTH